MEIVELTKKGCVRCRARVLSTKRFWGKNALPHLGTQCTRAISKKDGGFYCTTHTKSLKNGDITVAKDGVYDVEESVATCLKTNPNLLDHAEFITSQLSIREYIQQTLHKMEKNKERTTIQARLQSHIQNVFNKGQQNNDDVMKLIEIMEEGMCEMRCDENQIDLSRIDTSTLTTEYLENQKWWRLQQKVKITDYNTKSSTIFAVNDNKLYTQTRLQVGEIMYWKDDSIPDFLKNSDGIILEPYSHCYLTQVLLYPVNSVFHCLQKSKYTPYVYVKKFQKLQKTHEIEYL